MKVLIATVVAATVLTLPATADASERRHPVRTQAVAAANPTPGCVSWSEFDNMDYSTSRVNVENRWGVVGRGMNAVDPFLGSFIAYPKCGYEKGFPSLMFYYGVKYTNHEQDWMYLLYDH